jgi:hypothetical protein
MSAALLVVDGVVSPQPAGGTIVDIRVDRSDDPLGDLARLLDAADAFAAFDAAVEQLVGGDPAVALGTIDEALTVLPGEENFRFVRAGALAASGATDAGTAELRSLIASRATWDVIVRSFAAKGLMALPDGISIDALIGET